MVPVELLKTAVEQLPKWNVSAVTRLTSVNWRQGINALRDHLVSGVPGKDAWSQNGASKAQFYLNLGVLKEESERSRKLAPFYAAAEVADEQ